MFQFKILHSCHLHYYGFDNGPRHELAGIFYGENLEVIGELITFAREINFKSHGGIIYYCFNSGCFNHGLL